MAGNKILAAPSGQNTSPAGTEALPLTGSQYILINTVVAFALTAPTITGHPTIEGVTSTGATGTGKFVFDHTPTLVTPVLGVATVTSINKVALTAPATGSTLTIADGKTLTASNSLTLAGTDTTTMTFPSTSATIARTDAAQTFTGVQTFSTPIATGSVATMTATSGGGVPTPPNNTTTFLRGDGTFAAPAATAPGGSNTQVQYNNSSAFGGISGVTTDGTNLTLAGSSLTFSGAQSASGLFSTSGIREKGVASTFTDTQASTTVATAYVNVWGAPTFNASNTITVTNAFNAYFASPIAGTATLTNVWAIGADTFFVQNASLFNGRVNLSLAGGIQLGWNTTNNGWSRGGDNSWDYNATGAIFANIGEGAGGDFTTGSTGYFAFSSVVNGLSLRNSQDTFIGRLTTANVRLGKAASASPIANTLTIGEASRGGTDSNVGGANGTLQPGNGTGTGTASSLIFQTPTVAASGTTAQTQATRLTINSTGATFVPQVIHSLPENLKAYTVGTLPTGNPGDYAYVTDDTLSTWNSTLTGGSTGYTPVFKNATVWVSV